MSCGIAGGLLSGYLTVGAILFEKYFKICMHFFLIFFGIRFMMFFTHYFHLNLAILAEGAAFGFFASYLYRSTFKYMLAAYKKFLFRLKYHLCGIFLVLILINYKRIFHHYLSCGLGTLFGVMFELHIHKFIQTFEQRKVEEKEDAHKEISGLKETLHIYFGSQTGNAIMYTNQLQDEAQEKGYNTSLIDLKDFDEPKFLDHKYVLIVTSTHGDGGPPSNSFKFHEWLKAKDQKSLEGMKFTCFGLGDKSYYNSYNAMGKLVNKVMSERGATPFYHFGEGNANEC